MRIQLLKKENGFKPWLYDITDACQFLRKPSNANMIYFIKQIQNFTNFLVNSKFSNKHVIIIIIEIFTIVGIKSNKRSLSGLKNRRQPNIWLNYLGYSIKN